MPTVKKGFNAVPKLEEINNEVKGKSLMGKSQSLNLRLTVYASLFTALIIVGGQLSVPIPISPVPIALGDFFVMLAGLVLGTSWGLSSVGLFVFLGALGLPVFAQGKAGLAALMGPTGGYILGYLVCVFCIGLIVDKAKPSVVRDVLALIVGNISLYACGIPWLMVVTHLTWEKALAAGLTPFLIGAAIKIVAASGVAMALRSRFDQMKADSPITTGE